jgi:sulfite reductase (NADPH) flavoprotein alpha-component
MLPAHAPFSETTRRLIDSAIAGLDSTQRAWLSGFLAAPAAAAPASPVSTVKALILYGTESGNSEKLADRAAKEAKKKGITSTVKNMADLSPADLKKHANLLVVVSTWGDGEPPDGATKFYKEFMAGADLLPDLRYAVCGLGDTSYEKFCEIGKDFDTKLESLGAKRIAAREDCDVDFEDGFTAWLERSLTALAPRAVAVSEPAPAIVPTTSAFGLKNPFPAEVLENIVLNGKGSAKETVHVELSLAGSGLSYEPGDALAVIPCNSNDVVADLLQAAKLAGDESIETKASGKKALAEALREDLDITGLSRSVLTKLNEASPHPQLTALLDESAKEQLKNYNYGREIVDAITDFAPNGLPAQTLASLLRKLPPRLYSIASSSLAHPDEVHLTVAAVRYNSHGRNRKGVASCFLADNAPTGQSVKVYTHANKNFRLPENGDTPIIMVGPGTGIAPFRAFVEHRAELGQSGKSWLFFGDQHYLYDFLYQLEWQEHLKNGTLSRLDVAFSRDQPQKIYVQQRIAEKGRDLYDWLQNGAHFYVCGDASRMASDVHDALVSVYQMHGGFGREAAEAELEALKKAKRYQRDVY